MKDGDWCRVRGLSPPANFRHPAGVRRPEGTTDINRGVAKVPEGRRDNSRAAQAPGPQPQHTHFPRPGEGRRIRPAGAHERWGSVPGPGVVARLSPPANFRQPAGVRRPEGTTDINRKTATHPILTLRPPLRTRCRLTTTYASGFRGVPPRRVEIRFQASGRPASRISEPIAMLSLRPNQRSPACRRSSAIMYWTGTSSSVVNVQYSTPNPSETAIGMRN
jgi:hypothetical protein